MVEIKCVHCFSRISPGDEVYRLSDLIRNLTESKQAEESFSKTRTPGKKRAKADVGSTEFGSDSVFNIPDDAPDLFSENSPDDDAEEDHILGSEGMGMGTRVFLDGGFTHPKKINTGAEEYIKVSDFEAQLRKGLEEERITLDNAGENVIYELDNCRIFGKIYSGKIMLKYHIDYIPKYCPSCRKKLLKDSGRWPIFNIGLIGPSDAGKTLLLTIQYYIQMMTSKAMTVPDGRIYIVSDYSCVDEKSEDIIATFGEKFAQNCQFPPTTQQVIPNPHCLRIEYICESDLNVHNVCIVSFRDVKGEIFFTNKTRDQELNDVASVLQNADGFIVFTDPKTFEIDDDVISPELSKKCVSMINNLNAIFNNKGSEKPTVCLLAKEDMVAEAVSNNAGKMTARNQEDHRWLKDWLERVQGTELVFDGTTNLAKELIAISERTKRCMEKMVEGTSWYRTLEFLFPKAVYIPVSSVGKDRTVLKIKSDAFLVHKTDAEAYVINTDSFNLNNTVRQRAIAGFSPKYVELPLMYFLYKFSIIPPIYAKEAYGMKEEDNQSIVSIIRNALFGPRDEPNKEVIYYYKQKDITYDPNDFKWIIRERQDS